MCVGKGLEPSRTCRGGRKPTAREKVLGSRFRCRPEGSKFLGWTFRWGLIDQSGVAQSPLLLRVSHGESMITSSSYVSILEYLMKTYIQRTESYMSESIALILPGSGMQLVLPAMCPKHFGMIVFLTYKGIISTSR